MDALARLLSVGSEWGSFAAPIGGGVRRASKEFAEEASQRVGKEAAEQTLRERPPKEGWEYLYRAVEPEELKQIKQERRFAVLEFQTGKYFSRTLEGAARYARIAGRSGRRGPFTIVRTAVRTNLLRQLEEVEVDGGIPTVFVPVELLAQLGRPRILRYTPLVPVRW